MESQLALHHELCTYFETALRYKSHNCIQYKFWRRYYSHCDHKVYHSSGPVASWYRHEWEVIRDGLAQSLDDENRKADREIREMIQAIVTSLLNEYDDLSKAKVPDGSGEGEAMLMKRLQSILSQARLGCSLGRFQ